jgi:Ca2+/H+ antiporter, TMEM165/GDT1 family
MQVPDVDKGPSAVTQGGLMQSFAIIIFSEIGDKTFLIAAILAMRHPRAVVFAGAFGSLVVMSCLSAAMGHLLPTLVPRRWTQAAAAILFLVFGLKMLDEGRKMKGGSEGIQEEYKEVEEELEVEEAERDGTGARGPSGEVIPLEAMEGGQTGHDNGDALPRSRPKRSGLASFKEGARNFFALLLGPVFVQAFVLTFLGEWGDRSQIATIALAAAHVRVLSLSLSNFSS